jgi:rod shape-determining protein MreC
MLNFISRHKTGIVFVTAFIFLLSLVAAQIATPDESSLLAWVVYSAVSPIQQALSYVIVGSSDIWQEYVNIGNVRRENELLRAELAAEHVENQSLKERIALVGGEIELEAFNKVFQHTYITSGIKAYIIGAGISDDEEMIIVNQGALSGIEADMGVICPTGIVGKVITVGPSSSLVQLITDPDFSMAARLQGSRVRGLIRGAGGDHIDLDYIRDTDAILLGDRVVSSGLEQIFPQGILIGRISALGTGEPPLRKVSITPSANLRSLEWVLLVKWQKETTD